MLLQFDWRQTPAGVTPAFHFCHLPPLVTLRVAPVLAGTSKPEWYAWSLREYHSGRCIDGTFVRSSHDPDKCATLQEAKQAVQDAFYLSVAKCLDEAGREHALRAVERQLALLPFAPYLRPLQECLEQFLPGTLLHLTGTKEPQPVEAIIADLKRVDAEAKFALWPVRCARGRAYQVAVFSPDLTFTYGRTHEQFEFDAEPPLVDPARMMTFEYLRKKGLQ